MFNMVKGLVYIKECDVTNEETFARGLMAKYNIAEKHMESG